MRSSCCSGPRAWGRGPRLPAVWRRSGSRTSRPATCFARPSSSHTPLGQRGAELHRQGPAGPRRARRGAARRAAGAAGRRATASCSMGFRAPSPRPRRWREHAAGGRHAGLDAVRGPGRARRGAGRAAVGPADLRELPGELPRRLAAAASGRASAIAAAASLIQRSDDAEETVRFRLRTIAPRPQPVLDYFAPARLAGAHGRRRSATSTRSSGASTRRSSG